MVDLRPRWDYQTMKIGIFDPYLDTLSGGEKYMLSLALCLSQFHEVTVFWDTSKVADIKSAAQKKFGLSLDKLQFTANIFDHKVSLITRLWKSTRYDYIIVLSDGSIPLLACKLCLHFQTPVEWVAVDPVKSRIKMRRVHKIICNSFYTKSYIDKKFQTSSVVIYPPVSLYTSDKIIKKENIILNVGRFGIRQAGSSYKKQEFLVDAFKKLYDKGIKKWRFLVLVSIAQVDQHLLKDLEKQVSGYPVEFLVNPSNEILWNTYAKAKIYWHASGYGEDLKRYPDRAEHFGISTVEAMGKGVVPVVINAGGQKEIVTDEENGLLWNTEDELLDKTEALMHDSDKWSILSAAAIERSKAFNTQRFCREVHALMR